MQTILTFLLAGFATYSETYQRSIPLAAARLVSAPKYLLFPEQRAKKVRCVYRTDLLFSSTLFCSFIFQCSSIFRDSDYLFCKSFWNLVDHDYIKMGSRYIAPNVTVSKYFQIGPEPIELDGLIVPPPNSTQSTDENSAENLKKNLVNIKLLSHEIREGMNELPLNKNDLEVTSSKILPMSDQLLMHIHGGGFIATSSSTHEVFN